MVSDTQSRGPGRPLGPIRRKSAQHNYVLSVDLSRWRRIVRRANSEGRSARSLILEFIDAGLAS